MIYTIMLFFSLSLCILTAEAGISSDEREFVLSLHNQLRSSHNITVALKWDYVLAHQASRFTDDCEYNKKSTDPLKVFNALDNVAQGYQHWNQTVQAWYNGHKHYDFKNPGYTKNAGTFITMIWKGTTRMGCSKTKCSDKTLYQCVYSPRIPTHLIFDEAEYRSNVLLKEQ